MTLCKSGALPIGTVWSLHGMVMASNPPKGDQLDHHPQGLSDGVLGSEPGMLAGREPMDFKSNLPKLSTCSLRNLAEASKEDLLMFSGIPELSE